MMQDMKCMKSNVIQQVKPGRKISFGCQILLWILTFKPLGGQAGWNTKIYPSSTHTRNIWYLQQINQSPTSLSVVAETMKRSIEVATEGARNNLRPSYSKTGNADSTRRNSYL